MDPWQQPGEARANADHDGHGVDATVVDLYEDLESLESDNDEGIPDEDYFQKVLIEFTMRIHDLKSKCTILREDRDREVEAKEHISALLSLLEESHKTLLVDTKSHRKVHLVEMVNATEEIKRLKDDAISKTSQLADLKEQTAATLRESSKTCELFRQILWRHIAKRGQMEIELKASMEERTALSLEFESATEVHQRQINEANEKIRDLEDAAHQRADQYLEFGQRAESARLLAETTSAALREDLIRTTQEKEEIAATLKVSDEAHATALSKVTSQLERSDAARVTAEWANANSLEIVGRLTQEKNKIAAESKRKLDAIKGDLNSTYRHHYRKISEANQRRENHLSAAAIIEAKYRNAIAEAVHDAKKQQEKSDEVINEFERRVQESIVAHESLQKSSQEEIDTLRTASDLLVLRFGSLEMKFEEKVNSMTEQLDECHERIAELKGKLTSTNEQWQEDWDLSEEIHAKAIEKASKDAQTLVEKEQQAAAAQKSASEAEVRQLTKQIAILKDQCWAEGNRIERLQRHFREHEALLAIQQEKENEQKQYIRKLEGEAAGFKLKREIYIDELLNKIDDLEREIDILMTEADDLMTEIDDLKLSREGWENVGWEDAAGEKAQDWAGEQSAQEAAVEDDGDEIAVEEAEVVEDAT